MESKIMEKENSTLPINFLQEMSQFNFISKYARYDELHCRRETWEECVNRVLKMHLTKYKALSEKDLEKIKWSFQLVKEKKVAPSMRSMQFGGKAILHHNLKIYNCTVRQIDSIRACAEVMYALLCGCGVGIGITKQYINRLPDLVNAHDKTGSVITYTVQDSIEGWADSIESLLSCYFRNNAFSGRKIVFDYSKIRTEGSAIKTGGGKAPGYKGLKRTHQKIKQLLDTTIEVHGQKRIKPINIYDILMHCSDAVLSGGVRRSATIVVFDKDDMEMREAKTYFPITKYTRFSFDSDTKKWYGKVYLKNSKSPYEVEITDDEYKHDIVKNMRIFWKHIEPQRARSNNSVLLLRDELNQKEFEEIIQHTKEFGEPGFIFTDDLRALYNPCVEVGFIPQTNDGVCGMQNCNLTSVNGSKIHSLQDFLNYVEAATIIGTLQAGYTDFKYLSNAAKFLTEEEALLGVSIAGALDSPKICLDEKNQQEAAKHSVEINEIWAKKIGINQAARITLGKPDGNTSVTFGSAPGFHPHHARRYFRRIQCNKQDNIYKFFKQHNPHMCEEGVWSESKTDDVITFPITVSDDVMIKSDLSAIQHLEIIRKSQENWVNYGKTPANKKKINHNISCTVIVKDEEWKEVIEYVFKNKEYFTAISFIPFIGDKIYPQAPLESITTDKDEELWKKLVQNYKPVDYKKLYEEDDNTKMTEEAACAGGACLV